ncbi:MAG: 50S ribosomal protein L4 [Mariprofundales bacterium]
MPSMQVVDQRNNAVGEIELNAAVFGLEADRGFVHRVLSSLHSAQRRGTHSTKTRAEVSGGGKKPWKQKGTGRARTGSTRGAQWRHGGVAHGPKPHSYETRVNRKERRRAVRLALSEHVSQGSLIIIDELKISEVKTKHFVQVMQDLDVSRGMFVLAEIDNIVQLSGRNILKARIVLDGQINLHDIIKYDRLVITRAAVEKISERLS